MCILFCVVQLNAQDDLKCGFNRDFFDSSYQNWYKKAVLESNKSIIQKRWQVQKDTQYIIQVVFHLIYPSNKPLDISFIPKIMAEINADFSRLNPDTINLRPIFHSRAGNPKMKFVLADRDENGNPSNGYDVRLSSDLYGFELKQPVNTWHIMKFDSTGGIKAWNTKKYLNIWVCNLTSPKTGRIYLYGFATPPQNAPHWPSDYYGDLSIDGIVLDYNGYSNTSRSSLLTHEIGHYFGLRHVSGDPPAVFSSATICQYDDSIFDTPKVFSQNNICDQNINSCVDSLNDLPDMIENYMDYTGNRCRNTFTKKQVSLMRYCMNTLRTSLPKLVITPIIFQLDVYPNPSEGIFNINFRDSFSKRFSYVVYDHLGRKVKESKISEPKSMINLTGCANGLYELAIFKDQYEIVCRKKIFKN